MGKLQLVYGVCVCACTL